MEGREKEQALVCSFRSERAEEEGNRCGAGLVL
jgi:hypothetical protein